MNELSERDPRIQPPNAAGLFRYQCVCEVNARVRRGETISEAVAAVAATTHVDLDGQVKNLTERTLYRWLAAFKREGFSALLNRSRYAELTAPGFVCDVTKLERHLGVCAAIAPAEGLAATATWYREAGLL